MAVSEIAQRLLPTKDTVRDLFAHSGNRCAFPGCDHPLIDDESNFVAQTCHIEAAEPGGPRFNPAMTNEQRRHRDNLLLMCYRHHVQSNDVERFPVLRMREIKAAHEAAYAASPPSVSDDEFERAVQSIVASSIVDQTKDAALRLPQTLSQFSAEGTPEDERKGTIDLLVPMLERLRRLPVDTRGVLAVAVDRGSDYDSDVGLPVHELEHATRTDPALLKQHVETLSRYRIARLDEDFREYDSVFVVATSALDGWGFWRDLKSYSAATGIPLEVFIIDLRFDLLDRASA